MKKLTSVYLDENLFILVKKKILDERITLTKLISRLLEKYLNEEK